MKKLLLIFRTVRHLKPVQVWNRVWRRRPWINTGAGCGPAQSKLPAFTFLNHTAVPQGWNDPAQEKLWLYNLHYFEGCRDEALVAQWIRENPRGWGNGWEPYPLSLRVVNWIKNGFGERHAESIREQINWLLPRLEYHLLANHLLANAKALVFAGVALHEEKWLRLGLKIYARELPEQVLDDGVHFERSAMYHCIILEDMLDCAAISGEALFRTYAALMLRGLALLTGPDGQIAKFNDATEGIAKTPAQLQAQAAALGIVAATSRAEGLRTSGYLRQAAGEWTLLAKCGDIGPDYQPGHAHADTWSFELWRGARKMIGDVGCSTYVPGGIRSHERSTAAHNTVVIDGRDSSEVWASHRVGRRFDWASHQRRFELTAEGLRGVDELGGKGRHHVAVRFHLPPGVPREVVLIDCPGTLTWEACDFACGWNHREKGLCAVFAQEIDLPAQICWQVGIRKERT